MTRSRQKRFIEEVVDMVPADYKPSIDDKPFMLPFHGKRSKSLSWNEWEEWLKIQNAGRTDNNS